MSVASTTSVVWTTPVDCPSMETIRPSPADQRPPADRSPSSSVRFHSDQIHPLYGSVCGLPFEQACGKRAQDTACPNPHQVLEAGVAPEELDKIWAGHRERVEGVG